MMTDLIVPTDSRWAATISRAPHDFYHLPDYAKLEAKPGERAVGYWASDGDEACLLPLILKPIPTQLQFEESYDAISPYGYPGPIFTTPDVTFHRQAIASIAAELRRHDVISVFVRLHTLLNRDLSVFDGVGTIVQHGETVVVDTTQTDDEMWRQTRETHRHAIKRAIRLGATVEIDDEWNAFPDFHAAYIENMLRVRASVSYLFPVEYFHALRQALSGRLHLCVVRVNGSVASGAVFSQIGDIMQYHLGATASAALKVEPAKLMLHFVRSWARERRVSRLHLGGGVGGKADSLFLFKTGFSKWTVPFHTLRMPVQRELYERVVAKWEQEAGVRADLATGFFPAYRKPLESVGQ